MEREEYTRDNYPTSGKKYNGEKAIISLTSWRARINTVDKTIYSLIKQCPGFHIVLVLSEEEFPKREEELPERLMLFVENEMIELLWVYKNYKSFKKVLFTMDKYREVPVISADDDCIYRFNYAEQLYQNWLSDKKAFVTYYCIRYCGTPHTGGYATLHTPYCYGDVIHKLDISKLPLTEDDILYTTIRSIKHLNHCINLNKSLLQVIVCHDEKRPLHSLYRKGDFSVKVSNMISLVAKAFNS